MVLSPSCLLTVLEVSECGASMIMPCPHPSSSKKRVLRLSCEVLFLSALVVIPSKP